MTRKSEYRPKRELIRLSMSEKKGITSAITHAETQLTAMITIQTDQPRKVCECLCFESRKILKKMKRAETDYRVQFRRSTRMG